jgi:hypothetical protein
MMIRIYDMRSLAVAAGCASSREGVTYGKLPIQLSAIRLLQSHHDLRTDFRCGVCEAAII